MSDLSRVEQLLRNALGEDIYEVTPQSRVEILLAELNELIEGMGGGSVSPEDIATAVAAYLGEHLTNPTNPPVDTSLTIAGAAADAKKTGDEINDLKSGLGDLKEGLKSAITNVEGAIEELEAGSLSALGATDGQVPTANGDGTWEWAGGYGDPVKFYESRTVNVGSDTLGTATLGTGWTESSGVYTHANGNTADLDFETGLSVNDVAILDFDISNGSTEYISAGIGTAYRILTYNGTTHIRVPLEAIGNTTLHLTPATGFSGTLSNITLRKVQDEGTEVELAYENLFSENNLSNLGFWNVLLGDGIAQNAVGSTRTIVIGHNAMNAMQGGHRNIAIGTFAMSHLIGGERNVAIGADAMINVSGGYDNVAIGINSMCHGGSGSNSNVAIGSNALGSQNSNTNAVQANIAIGKNAGAYTKSNQNTFIGDQAGYRNRTGARNIIIGASALGCDGGDDNTLIGAAIATTTALSKSIGIGRSAIPTKSQQMMLGSTDITEVVFCGNKKINFNNDGTVTWEALS